MKLVPINDSILVEWNKSPYDGVPIPEGKYASRTEGVVISFAQSLIADYHENDLTSLIGKKVFWEEYKDTIRAEMDGKTYAFIKFEDIRGYETN